MVGRSIEKWVPEFSWCCIFFCWLLGNVECPQSISLRQKKGVGPDIESIPIPARSLFNADSGQGKRGYGTSENNCHFRTSNDNIITLVNEHTLLLLFSQTILIHSS